MAVVYLAFDPYMERRVAVKLLLKDRSHDANLRSRFKRESRMVASLNHPAIVPVYDFGEKDEQPYLVMRYMEGGSLRERLRDAPLTLQEVARILNQIAPALDTTHSHNIIHRDLKPSNILFDSQGKAYLADFGLAKFAEGTYTTLTRNDGMVGTPAYMSPEQIRAQSHLDGRSDVYALGVILFEMLAGRLPFTASGRLPVALMHLADPVPEVHTLNLSLPKSVSPIIGRAMAKNREDRFAKASDLVAPFLKAAQVTDLPPVEFPQVPPIILQPDSESGSSLFSTQTDGVTDAASQLPEWLLGWLTEYSAKQDIGRSRTRGTLEDRLRVGNVQTAGGLHLLLAIVSDGSSSPQHGHLAAELAINELFNRVEQAETAVSTDIPAMLHQVLQQANHTLFSVAHQKREPLVMRSVVTMVAIHENKLFLAHVGNGRIYLLRNRKLHLLNRPTSVKNVLIDEPQPSTSQSPNSHSSAIGLAKALHVDLGLYLSRSDSGQIARQNQGLPLQTNDRLLLCSDGLIAPNGRHWQQRRLRRILAEKTPADAAKILVQDALDRNVADNVTAVVLQSPGSHLHIPLFQRRPLQFATATFATLFLLLLLLFLPDRPGAGGVLVPPGTATQIALILNGLTATAASNQAALPTELPLLIAPEAVPDPGFAVIFAAGEGAQFRTSGQSDWQTARAGDLVKIGENAAIRSGVDRMGVVLSDGAELYLDSEVEMALNTVYQATAEMQTTQVSLANGRLLIHYKNADMHNFELNVPSAAKVLLATNNNVAGVIYDENTAVLELDCFTGDCLLRGNQNRQLRLPPGRYGVANGTNLTTHSTARVLLYCDLAPTLVACPAPTAEPTQTLPPIIQTVIAGTETANAQTATPTPTLTPSITPTSPPTTSVTPLPTVTSQPGSSSTPTTSPASTSTPRPTSQPPTQPPGSTPTPPNTVTPVASSPPATAVPSNTPQPSNTPTSPLPTSTLRFTATPLPTFTPTKDPNS